jgi:hypothetical protein
LGKRRKSEKEGEAKDVKNSVTEAKTNKVTKTKRNKEKINEKK